jgi:hypothetical protein
MKKIIKILGVITFAVIIGLSMTGCSDEPDPEPEPGKGTVEVSNDSNRKFDITEAGVIVMLYKDGEKVDEITGVQTTATKSYAGDEDDSTSKDISISRTKTKAVFLDVKEGDNYQIWVKDTNPDASKATYKSGGFSLTKDETLKFSYTGTAIGKK